MNESKLNRINELAHKAKSSGLTPEEKKEHHRADRGEENNCDEHGD